MTPLKAMTSTAAAAAVLVMPALATAGTHALPVTKITHIVVLMQENHSFDSELGGWCNQPAGLNRCLVNGQNTGIPAGPVTLSDGSQVTPAAAPDTVAPIDHSTTSQAAAINGGLMNGWEHAGGCSAAAGYACMNYYPAAAVPNLAALATAGTVLDQAFTMTAAPSFAGHLDLITGTNDGFSGNNPWWQPNQVHGNRDWGCDSNMVGQMQGAPAVRPQPACVPDFNLDPQKFPYGGAFGPTIVRNVPTILDQLTTSGVSWAIYGALPTDPGGAFWSACPLAASCLDTGQFAHVHELGQFFTDASAGTLPAVSLVFPEGTFTQGGTQRFGGLFSQHNSQSNSAGDNFIGMVASAVQNGPAWPSSALIVSYDDCGCFYDSVAPPAGMGIRVPFVIDSPYVLPSSTDATPTSSTGSILAFIEADFNLPPLSPAVASADNLMGDFSFGQAPAHGPQMVWRSLPAQAYHLAWSTIHSPT